MAFYHRYKAPQRNTSTTPAETPLMERKGVWKGHTVDWSPDTQAVVLTGPELIALQRKHGTKDINISRATKVKALMLDGKTQTQIIRDLRLLGRGFQERMVKADHAALSKYVKNETKKVQ
jgi:hypothetical protein